ncbi:unnamed protein product [Mesocestoides corti]|uniref:Uncharacterized protein n=1 Tax=Mesocestoides corti TaxID=53468 RepID=A0A0R3UJF0_MESCO|nr:unnamed protein product [Mesocestoides corti]
MDGCKEYELPGRSMLDYSNLQQPLDCNTLCDSQATELCDQTDAMSDFLLSLVNLMLVPGDKLCLKCNFQASPTSLTQEYTTPYHDREFHISMSNPQPSMIPIASDYGMQDVAFVTDWRRRCEDEAFDIVNRLKTSQHLQENRMTNSELGCIEEVFTDIRQHLHPSNLKCFEQSVEQLISHIVLNLSPSILPIPTSNGASGASGGNTNADESACPRQSTT